MLTSTSFRCIINVSISKTCTINIKMTFKMRGGRILVKKTADMHDIMKKIKRFAKTTDIISLFKLFSPALLFWAGAVIESSIF